MAFRLLVAGILLVFAALPETNAQNACGLTANGHTFSFSALTASSYSATDTAGYQYKFNPCGVVGETTCATESGTICQYNGGTNTFQSMVAAWPGATWALINPSDPTKGVKAHFTNGDVCNGAPRTSDFLFTCVENVKVGTLAVSSIVGGCNYEISFPTMYACLDSPSPPNNGGGGSSSLSGGWIFVIILVCVIPVYVVVGCIINHQRTPEANWREKCPQSSFWCGLPGLVKEGCMFTFAKLRGLCGGRQTATEGQAYEKM